MATATLDLDLLRAFVTVAEAASFTRAAERLGRTQSTISLQIKRLETALGAPVFERGARPVRVSGEGEMLLGYAREMLRLNDEVVARMREPELTGRVRLGTPEDFATSHLPDVLSEFGAAFPGVALEVTCDLTLNLLDRFAAGEFDLVLIKREPAGPMTGVEVWREPLVWVGRGDTDVAGDRTLPLVVSPHPCVYRKRAQTALDSVGRRWRIAYTSTSLAGTQAAVQAGLGLTVLPKAMVPPGLRLMGPAEGLPRLAETEIALCRAPGTLSRPADRLAGHIVTSLERQAAGRRHTSAPAARV